MQLNDKKVGLRKEFTYNRRKKDGEEGPPQAPPREGMYRLGVGWESIVGGLYTLFGRWGCTDRVWVC